MNSIIIKLKSLLNGVWGEIIKIACNFNIIKPLYTIGDYSNNEKKIIVTLTSYGRRVSSILHYTIISLLRQTRKPDMIILWLDNVNWCYDNLPKNITKLQKLGVQVRFCEDLKSYKKLIPTLKEFPNDIIITCDDDIFYKSNMIEMLVIEYEKNPNRVYAHRGHMIKVSNTGIMPYNEWTKEVSDVESLYVLPTTGGGCLYTSNLLYKDTTDSSIFMKLAPKADDLWLYFMVYLNRTPIYVLPTKGYIYTEIDFFYQRMHTNASLYRSNCGESQNDLQIKNIISYYNIDFLEDIHRSQITL